MDEAAFILPHEKKGRIFFCGVIFSLYSGRRYLKTKTLSLFTDFRIIFVLIIVFIKKIKIGGDDKEKSGIDTERNL